MLIGSFFVANTTTRHDYAESLHTRCRDVALLLFLFHSALRRHECARLLWSNLMFDKRGVVVVIRQSKTDKESKGQNDRDTSARSCVLPGGRYGEMEVDESRRRWEPCVSLD